MKIGRIKKLLISFYNNVKVRHQAVFLLGKPGGGKSAIVYQMAEELNLPVIDLRLAQCDPTDLRGVPSVVNGRTVWNAPAIFPDPDKSPKGILFLDEITSAPPAVQAVAYQVVYDRAVGEYKFPDGWMIICAGNYQTDRGVTFAMPAPLMNRMCVLHADIVAYDNTGSGEDWITWAAANGCDPRVLAFIMYRADYIHKFEKEHYGRQSPSPRGWMAASDKLALAGLSDMDRVEVLKGCVGETAAVDFESFLRVRETMPSINRIIEDPDSVEVPQALNVRYCVAMGLSARMDKDNFNDMWRFIQRMPAEFQTLIVKLAFQRDPGVMQATKFSEWVIANNEAFKQIQ
jgi:hypothetical protein